MNILSETCSAYREVNPPGDDTNEDNGSSSSMHIPMPTPPKLSLNSDRDYEFLRSQTSKPTVFILTFFLTLISATYLLFALSYPQLGERDHHILIIFGRVARVISCVFPWGHVYTLHYPTSVDSSASRTLLHPAFWANQFVLWSSIIGGFILISRCYVGECEEEEPDEYCNPRHEAQGLPTVTLIGNLFIVMFILIIFKVHDYWCILASGIITMASFTAAIILAEAYSDIPLVVSALAVVAVVIYEAERTMVTIYETLKTNRVYYEELLVLERSKKTMGAERDQLRSMIGNVAHDLKTPLQAFVAELEGLNAALSNIRRLAEGNRSLGPGSAWDEVLHHASESLDYVTSLKDIYQFMMLAINRMIDYRKATAGLKLLASNETFHLPQAMGWALARFTSRLTDNEIKLTCHSNTDICPHVISDKHWLVENILSLTSNACKFTPSGTISVRCAIVEDVSESKQDIVSFDLPKDLYRPVADNILAAAQKDDNTTNAYFVLVEVEDSGIGVPTHKVRSLFQPFGQAQRRSGGTGLGLFSLRNRMEVLGGRCGVYNRTDGESGACFWFCFPYVADFGGSADLSPSQTTVNRTSIDEPGEKVEGCLGKGLKVLVVDDSMIILKTTAKMLEKEGFQVYTEKNGASSLEVMKTTAYDFVLTDIQMPIMDGIESTRRFRSYENDMNVGEQCRAYRKRQYIIGMSANADAETRKEALESGMDDFLSKPVRMDALAHVLPFLSPV